MRFAGSTTIGILNGSRPAPLADRLLERFNQIDVAVTFARHMQRTLGRLGLPTVKVIPNPVDLERFRPMTGRPALRRELEIGDDAIVVAHVSNLKWLKRPLDIVNAAEITSREDDRLVFLVVGDGPLRTELQEVCRERGLAARFGFQGWVDYERVPISSVAPTSSSCRRRGLVCGIGCGLVVDPHNPAAIAAAIERLLNDPTEAEAMGRRGQEAVSARFNWDREANRVLSLYRALGSDGARAADRVTVAA
jgi:glycosyltransferase involved in cell wall biosynthesis